jgi:hypothetical protein
MYFGNSSSIRIFDLSLANSSISEYFGQLPCFVAATAAYSYLSAWRNWSVEISIVLFSTYTSSGGDRRSSPTSI